MRVCLLRWAMASLLCGTALIGTGCRSGGTSGPGGGWLSWNKKQDATSAVAATKPSTQLPPSPAQTVGAGAPAVAAGGAAGAYPSTGVGATGYTAMPVAGANPTAQPAGYYTGPYGTNGPAPNGAAAYTADRQASPYPQTAAGGYGAPAASGYGAPAAQGYGAAAPAGYGAPSNYGAPAGGAPAGAGYGSTGYGAPAAAPQGGGYAPAPAGGAGYAAPGGGFAPGGGYAPSGVAPAGGGYPAGGAQYDAEPAQAETGDGGSSQVVPASPYANREGGYRPGSTGRARPTDGAMQSGASGVQPANYQMSSGPTGGAFQP